MNWKWSGEELAWQHRESWAAPDRQWSSDRNMAKPDGWGWTLYWGTEWGKKTFQIKQHRSVLLTSGLPPPTLHQPPLRDSRGQVWTATHFLSTSLPASKVREFGRSFPNFQQQKASPCCQESPADRVKHCHLWGQRRWWPSSFTIAEVWLPNVREKRFCNHTR